MRNNVHDLEVSTRINEFQTIDVAPAFAEQSGLYDGAGRYANLTGQRVWCAAVTDSLTSSVTVPRR